MSPLQEKDTEFLNLFEYCTVPKIHNEPDYESLKTLKDKIIANSSGSLTGLAFDIPDIA